MKYILFKSNDYPSVTKLPMKDLAPHIYRQRLIIEGLYTIAINPTKLEEFMQSLSRELTHHKKSG